MGSGSSIPKTKPKLYMFAFSAPCRAVMMAAKAIKVELELVPVDLMKGENKQEAYTKINPEGKVPTLTDDLVQLSESRAIMQYLVNRYSPGSPLYPVDPARRAQVDRMLQYDQGTVYLAVSEYIYPQLFAQQPPDDEKKTKVEAALTYLEKLLQNQSYVAAAHLTIADLTITANLSLLEVKGWSFDQWPTVATWREKISKEPWYDEVNIGLREFIKNAISS
jgi:glutathione S-transferase